MGWNIKIYRNPIEKNIDGKLFYIAHGDGIGPGDYKYKFIKKVFSNKVCQRLFAYLHPGFGLWLATYFSTKSRIANGNSDEIFLGEEKERLIQFINEKEKTTHFDYYIFGHRHLPIDMQIKNTRYINLGEWVNHFSYATWANNSLELCYFKP